MQSFNKAKSQKLESTLIINAYYALFMRLIDVFARQIRDTWKRQHNI